MENKLFWDFGALASYDLYEMLPFRMHRRWSDEIAFDDNTKGGRVKGSSMPKATDGVLQVGRSFVASHINGEGVSNAT